MMLAEELAAFRQTFMTKAPPEIRDAMARADLGLEESAIAERAAKAGEVEIQARKATDWDSTRSGVLNARGFGRPRTRGALIRSPKTPSI